MTTTETYDKGELTIWDIRSGHHQIRYFRDWQSCYRGYLIAKYGKCLVALCESSNGQAWGLISNLEAVSEEEYLESKSEKLRQEVKNILYEKVYDIDLDSLSKIVDILSDVENLKARKD